MGRRTWSDDELAVLERYIEAANWLDDLKRVFPNRTVASIRGRRQKMREELGFVILSDVGERDCGARFRANAVNGTQRLLERTLEASPPLPQQSPPRPQLSFDEQLRRVERGEVGIAPVFRIVSPPPNRTLGGVSA